LKRLIGFAMAASLAFAVAPGAVAHAASPALKVKVKISDFKFSPTPLQITKGTVVIWVNKGPSTHTTTSNTGAWDSGPLVLGAKFKKRFKTDGTFLYHCSIHPFMTAEIDVTG
jgi:plastocyanin